MKWRTVYTPQSSGTVLSPDNYHQTHKPEIFGFFQSGNSNNIGKIGFVNNAGDMPGDMQESISLKRNNNGQWMTTNVNRVLLPTQNFNKYINKIF